MWKVVNECESFRCFPQIMQSLMVTRVAKGYCETPNFRNWWFEPVFSRRMVPEGVDLELPALSPDRQLAKTAITAGGPTLPQPGGPVLTTVNVPLKTRDRRAPARAEDCMLLAAEKVSLY